MTAPTGVTIPKPPKTYDPKAWQQILKAIADELNGCVKKNADIRIHTPVRLTLIQPDGTERSTNIDNTGAINTDSYP